MKIYLVFLSFFNLLLFISHNQNIISNKEDDFPVTDTVITDNINSGTPDFFDSTDYSIEIQDSNGAKIKLGNWQGKNLLIIYAHSDCPYCKKLVKKYEAEIQNADLKEIVLFSGSDTAEIKEFREETSLKYPYYFDFAFQFKKVYGTHVVPVSFLIKSDGTAERIAGLKQKEVEALIRKINEG